MKSTIGLIHGIAAGVLLAASVSFAQTTQPAPDQVQPIAPLAPLAPIAPMAPIAPIAPLSPMLPSITPANGAPAPGSPLQPVTYPPPMSADGMVVPPTTMPTNLIREGVMILRRPGTF